MKKVLTLFLIIFTMINFTYAGNLIDVFSSDEILKFSDIENLNLPFILTSSDRIIVDKLVDSSGILFANKNLLTEQDIKGMHIITSAETVTINESIENSIIIARNVIINGTIERDSIILAGSVVVSESANVLGDLMIAASSVKLEGDCNANVIGSINDLNCKGIIKGDLRVTTDTLSVDENSYVEGNVVINTTNKDITTSNTFEKAEIEYRKASEQGSYIDYRQLIIGFVINSILFSLVYILFRSKTKIIGNTLEKIKTYPTFFCISGFLSVFVVIVALILLFILSFVGIDVITIPLFVIILVSTLLFATLNILTIGSVIFRYIESKKQELFNNNISKMFGSFIVFFLLYMITIIPNIGETISFILSCLSIGILWINIFRRNKVSEVSENK